MNQKGKLNKHQIEGQMREFKYVNSKENKIFELVYEDGTYLCTTKTKNLLIISWQKLLVFKAACRLHIFGIT